MIDNSESVHSATEHGEGLSSGRPLHAVIDRQAFRDNIQRVEDLTATSSLIVVVKANAYGHGLLELAREVGKRDLAVAIPQELNALRQADIRNRVWVLEGPFSEQCLRAPQLGEVVWVVHSLWQLALLERQGRQSVCLKLDTGMNRLGLSLEDFSSALEIVEKSPSLDLYACMTHFLSSDLPDNERVKQQLALFDRVAGLAKNKALINTAANSGGILFYPESHKDCVRPGIILYGAMPSPTMNAEDYQLKPVMKLQSAVIALRKVKVGESVGYGGRWRAKRDSVIAVIAAGYGDGYPRHAPDGTPVAIFDHNTGSMKVVPLVGQVSMDMLTIDVSDIEACAVGDLVELWGVHVSADLVARASETIAYELFCNVTTRVPRYYI